MDQPVRVLLFANSDWYLYNFRLPLALALKHQGYEVVLVSPPGIYASRIEEAGLRWISLPFSRRGSNPFTESDVVWRLHRLYRQERPQIVHHFTVKCVLYGSLAAHLNGIRQVINAVTGLGYVFIGSKPGTFFLRPLVRLMYRLSLRGTRVVFQNVEDQDIFLSNRLVRHDQVHLIEGSGVDTQRFVPSDFPPEPVVVVLPARMLWDKGVGEFVQAARILKSQGVHARFALVGNTDSGNPAAVPSAKLAEWDREGVVELWGWQEDMPAVYRNAHVICLPSYREGLSRTLVEAAACGRPLVASDVPGCRGIVYNGENGMLVPPRDANQLAAALACLIADPQLRRQMGECGRRLVEDKFSAQKIIEQTIAIYHDLLRPVKDE